MASIELDDGTTRAVLLAARVGGVTPAKVIQRAIEAFAFGQIEEPTGRKPGSHSKPRTPDQKESALSDRRVGTQTLDGTVAVYMKYMDQIVFGFYHIKQEWLRIDDGPVQGRFSSPSKAACEVVQAVSPNREHVNTNGRSAWRILSNKKELGAVYPRGSL